MRHTLGRFFVGLLLAAWLAFYLSPAAAEGEGLLDRFKKVMKQDETLSDAKIIDGLKEALHVGAGNAVELVSKAGGYYQNPKIRIPLPASIQKVEKVLRTTGYGDRVDAFEMSMNTAAEKAAPEAKAIFWEAIKKITISDGRKILDGREDEATLFFKEKTYNRLSETFKPIVHETMADVGVTRIFQDLDARMRTMPFVDSLAFDLDGYVTAGALDGLFLMLAEEEKKIRRDPAARVTDLLKEVFNKP